MYDTSGRLNGEDIEFLKNQHSGAHETLCSEVRNVSMAGWTFKPDASVWSAAELVEHVLLVERAMLDRIGQHMEDSPGKAPNPSEFEALKGQLLAVVPNQGKVFAPPSMCEFSGIPQETALSEINLCRSAFAEFIDRHSDRPLKAITWNHSLFGKLSAFHWLLYIPLHTLRHARQLGRSHLNSNI